MGSYRTERLRKAGREGWASPATVSVGTKSTEAGEYKGLEGSRKRQQKERHKPHLYQAQTGARQTAADKRWVEELCEQQSGKQVSQRPRAKQRELKEPGGRYLPTVLGTESSAAHVLDKCSITEWQAQLGKVDTLLKDRVFHRLALPASKSVKRLSQFP